MNAESCSPQKQQALSIDTECRPQPLEADTTATVDGAGQQPPLMDTLGICSPLSDATSMLIADVAFAAATIVAGIKDNEAGDSPQVFAGNQDVTSSLMGLLRTRGGPGHPNYNEYCATCNPTFDPTTVVIDNSYTVQVNFLDENIGQSLRTGMSIIFIAGEMAGIGMIVAPWAVVNLGWMGLILLLAFAVATAYSTILLGTCWLILEERFFECRQYPCEDTYATIAYHAVGYKTSILTKVCIHITLIGAATIYLLLIAQSTQKLFLFDHPEISYCGWLFVFATAISSLMFMDSPKEFSILVISSMVATMAAGYLIIMQLILDDKHNTKIMVPHKDWDVNQFFLSFGTILFALSSATSFPTIQNNIFKHNEWSHSVVACFTMLGILFTTIIIGGYIVYGHDINPNILMSLGDSWCSYIAIILMCAQLVIGFLIIINPVAQNFENILNRNATFKYQRFLVRVTLLLFIILLGETIPHSSDLIALLGSSTIMLVTFVFPSVYYLSLCSKTSSTWSDRRLSWKSKICLYSIIIVSTTGGVLAMYTTLMNIFSTDPLAKPCYWSIFSSES